MNNLNRYLKIAKDAVIEPEEDIEDKIIDRISHIREKDKELLDENFQDFFKKSNSRSYLMGQRLKDHPGTFTFVALIITGIFALIAYIIKLLLVEEKKTSLKSGSSSPKNKAQD